MKYQQLPAQPRPGVVLHCPSCSEDYSATRGDYFLCLDAVARCGSCNEALVLARRTTRYVRISPSKASYA